MRETMKRKIYKLQGKDVDDNFEWEEGEPGPEDEARWREEEESLRRKQAAESTQAAKDDMERRVKSKVNEGGDMILPTNLFRRPSEPAIG